MRDNGTLDEGPACREIARLKERVRVLEEAVKVAVMQLYSAEWDCKNVQREVANDLEIALTGGKGEG